MATLAPFKRLVVAVGLFVILMIALGAATLWLPDRPVARADEPSQAEPTAAPTDPVSPPPPPRLNPPIATPAPGALQVESTPAAGDSDLEVVKFRPDLTLKKSEAPPQFGVASGKPAQRADPNAAKPVETLRPPAGYQSQGANGPLASQAWTPLVYEGFEGAFPNSLWAVYDFSNDGYERFWDDTNYGYQYGSWSAWPAAGGADRLDPRVTTWYTDNLYSWMEYGPVDLSGMTDVFVSFGLYYHTEPDFDRMYFCASTDGQHYNCDYWSGDSGGWTDQAYWMTSYAGYDHVYFAWVFISDFSISDHYFGPYVDEVSIWGDTGAAPTPTPTCLLDGQLIQNCGFETGDLTNWNPASSSSASAPPFQPDERVALPVQTGPNADGAGPTWTDSVSSVQVTNTSSVDGVWSAVMWRPGGAGQDYLYQTISVPAGVTSMALDFWFGVTTRETNVGTDFFCASLQNTSRNQILVDLGCLDATYTDGYWHDVTYTLNSTELASVRDRSVTLVFEVYNNGGAGSGSAGWVDFVRALATGGSGGTAADPNEPNDDWSTASAIACGQTITSGVIGDAMGSYDIDWFRLSNVPTGRLDIDIDADAKMPSSALDSVTYLYDANRQVVAYNDDDGLSYDSYIVYTNSLANATFYVSVEPYTGHGSSDSFYDLTAQCAGSGTPPDDGTPTTITPITDTWTVMLYLNAEDPDFVTILTQYRQGIESFIGSKNRFLTVTILYDPPGTGGTTRYLVQPNGSYQDNVNRWNMGELNMGDPSTLANFVNWSMDQYPAENYYLAVDDHGDGAYGISFDASSLNDQLSPPELYSALKEATRNGARKIDIFDYEACLMGLAENAYDLRAWVDYVVFFQQISWGINTYPVYFGDLAATDTPLTVGQRIVYRYHTGANAGGYPHTISLIDTSRMGAVNSAVTNFGNALRATNNLTAVLGARDHAQAFAADSDATNPARADYIDLWDLAYKANSLRPTEAAAVLSAVTAAVLAERHASGGVDGNWWIHNGAHGLSIFYPASRRSGAFASYTAGVLYEMSREGQWDEFLTWGVPSGNRRGMSGNRTTIKLTGDNTTTFVFKYVYLPLIRK